MSNVNVDGIVTPDEENLLDPEVWSSAMADSISQGIGKRVKKQETAIGCKAGLPGGVTIDDTIGTIAPYEILATDECFAEGLTLTGGVVTVSVEGMYFVSAAASLEPWNRSPQNENRTIAIQIKKNNTQLVGAEVTADESYWQTAQSNTVVRCVPGDRLYVTYYSAGLPLDGTAVLSLNTAMNSLSIVLVTPVGE